MLSETFFDFSLHLPHAMKLWTILCFRPAFGMFLISTFHGKGRGQRIKADKIWWTSRKFIFGSFLVIFDEKCSFSTCSQLLRPFSWTCFTKTLKLLGRYSEQNKHIDRLMAFDTIVTFSLNLQNSNLWRIFFLFSLFFLANFPNLQYNCGDKFRFFVILCGRKQIPVVTD